MCFICIEFQKENLKPKDFIKNLMEVVNEKQEDPHLEDIIKVVDSLSQEYKDAVEKSIEEDYLNGKNTNSSI